MKKFSFSLQKLMDYKQQLFDVESTILGEMRAVLNRLNDELAQLRDEHARRSQDFNQKIAAGATAQEIELHKVYMRMIDHQAEQKQVQIQMQQQAVEKQTDKVREAKIELSTIEKLREKKLEEYNYLADRAQELFIEEFVSNKKASAQSL